MADVGKELRIATEIFNDATNILETCSADLQNIYMRIERQHNSLKRAHAGLYTKDTTKMIYSCKSSSYRLEIVNSLLTNIVVVEETMKKLAAAIGKIGYAGGLVRNQFELPEELCEESNQPWDPSQEVEAEQAAIAAHQRRTSRNSRPRKRRRLSQRTSSQPGSD